MKKIPVIYMIFAMIAYLIAALCTDKYIDTMQYWGYIILCNIHIVGLMSIFIIRNKE